MLAFSVFFLKLNTTKIKLAMCYY